MAKVLNCGDRMKDKAPQQKFNTQHMRSFTSGFPKKHQLIQAASCVGDVLGVFASDSR